MDAEEVVEGRTAKPREEWRKAEWAYLFAIDPEVMLTSKLG